MMHTRTSEPDKKERGPDPDLRFLTVLLGSAMAIVMLGWMWKMHPDRRRNVAIVAGAAVVGVAAFLFSQQAEAAARPVPSFEAAP